MGRGRRGTSTTQPWLDCTNTHLNLDSRLRGNDVLKYAAYETLHG